MERLEEWAWEKWKNLEGLRCAYVGLKTQLKLCLRAHAHVGSRAQLT
jgi:hypothetical protein